MAKTEKDEKEKYEGPYDSQDDEDLAHKRWKRMRERDEQERNAAEQESEKEKQNEKKRYSIF